MGIQPQQGPSPAAGSWVAEETWPSGVPSHLKIHAQFLGQGSLPSGPELASAAVQASAGDRGPVSTSCGSAEEMNGGLTRPALPPLLFHLITRLGRAARAVVVQDPGEGVCGHPGKVWFQTPASSQEARVLV